MKYLFIFLLHIFLFSICFSQQKISYKNDSSKVLDAENVAYKLDVGEKSKLATRLPFSKINFFDVRYDTSFIAINWMVNTGLMIGNKTYNKKFNVTGGVATGLSNYFNEYYKDDLSGNGAELLCFVKRFSITLKDTLAEYRHRNATINTINFELECFYKQGNLLFPAIRFDTTYAEAIPRIRKTFSGLVEDIIRPFIDKVNSMDTVHVLKRKSHTEEEIKDRYQSRFNIPILTDNQYKKGVYLNFIEFRNNAPSITNFKIKTDRSANLLYDSSDNLVASNVFGFSDGSTCWIQNGAYYYPLVRVGNSFEFLFTFYVRSAYSYSVIKLLLALNMETGKVE